MDGYGLKNDVICGSAVTRGRQGCITTPSLVNLIICFLFALQYLGDYVEDLSAMVFDHFLSHLSLCAQAFRVQAEREQRRIQLIQLFASCDNTGVSPYD